MSLVHRNTQTENDKIDEMAKRGHSNSVRPKRKEKQKMAETWGEMLLAWPYATFLIVLNEFCQKFASLSTILPLYFLNVLKFSTNKTTIIMQIYQILCGIFPLMGSALADVKIGKYNTILYGTLLYGVGKILMSVAAFMRYGSAFHPLLDYAGILIICIGMGGIIPCVASFGGDQFESHQERMISIFFSIFYASINAGALISTLLMPVLRSQPCLDQDSCYPLSFGVSASFMIIAAVIFVIGSKWYKKQPPSGNVFADVYDTVKTAWVNRRYSGFDHDHWLDYYFDTHDCQLSQKCLRLKRRKRDATACERANFVEDIRALLRILVMYLPLPMFWALYDQQYSVWLYQAIQMDCRLWGGFLLLPDMMQVVNPVLILVFIFIFESFIYPIVSYFVNLTPLRKMVAGGVLASLAFFVSAQVQQKVNVTLPELPQPGHAFVSFMNNFDNCTLTVTYDGDEPSPTNKTHVIHANGTLGNKEMFHVPLGHIAWNIDYEGGDCKMDMNGVELSSTQQLVLELIESTIHFVSISPKGVFIAPTDPTKPTKGTGEFSVSINVAFTDSMYTGNFALCRANTSGTNAEHPCDPQRPEDFYFWETSYDDDKSDGPRLAPEQHPLASLYDYKPVRPGKWMLHYMFNTPRSIGQKTMSKEQVNVSSESIVDFQIEDQGGVYAIVLTGTKEKPEKRVFQVVPSNTVSILWQLPQIAIITAAEILFSITGYEFAYSQSGASMKSIMQALWFLTVAVGDLIIIAVTLLDFGDMAQQFNIYAVVMLVVIFIFALQSIFYYEYRIKTEDDDDNNLEEDDEEEEGEWTHKNNGIDVDCGQKKEGPLNGISVLKSRALSSRGGLANIGYQKNESENEVWNSNSSRM